MCRRPFFRCATALLAALLAVAGTARAEPDMDLPRLVATHVRDLLPADGLSGLAVVVRFEGRTSFFNFGVADGTSRRPITSDLLFNLGSLGKVFDTTLLAQAVGRGELGFDDPVAKYVTELRQGGDIRRVTLGQLVTYTSGLVMPQDHPPWPQNRFTQPEFLRYLEDWTADAQHQPGKQSIYSHAGFVLLHLALERRYGMPIWQLMDERLLRPLGLHATVLPPPGPDNPRGELDAEQKSRAVQGYTEDGERTGEPGDIQGYYLWAGTGQMFSTPRDMAVFLAANLGEGGVEPSLHEAMTVAQRGVFPLDRCVTQALAWETRASTPKIVDKYGGLNDATAYIGLMPEKHIGVVLLANRGSQNLGRAGRDLMLALAQREGDAVHACSPGE
ncbi:MAG TPA: serine hydrolase [Xanthobacteraceae bacterium]|nr:serine hydrolase [Xanthobacteraceae bacterium]